MRNRRKIVLIHRILKTDSSAKIDDSQCNYYSLDTCYTIFLIFTDALYWERGCENAKMSIISIQPVQIVEKTASNNFQLLLPASLIAQYLQIIMQLELVTLVKCVIYIIYQNLKYAGGAR